MAQIKIPVSKIKTPWLRRLVIALTLPFVLALRIAFLPVSFVVLAIDGVWSLVDDLCLTTRGAINAWRNATTTKA